jgi:hypothetical protein
VRVYSLDKVKASLKQEKYIIKKKLVLVCTSSPISSYTSEKFYHLSTMSTRSTPKAVENKYRSTRGGKRATAGKSGEINENDASFLDGFSGSGLFFAGQQSHSVQRPCVCAREEDVPIQRSAGKN